MVIVGESRDETDWSSQSVTAAHVRARFHLGRRAKA
jgi:hypothetical protein